MTENPAEIPETSPEDDPMVATGRLLLNQVPPPASESSVVKPTHTVAVPEMAAGAALTVTGSTE